MLMLQKILKYYVNISLIMGMKGINYIESSEPYKNEDIAGYQVHNLSSKPYIKCCFIILEQSVWHIKENDRISRYNRNFLTCISFGKQFTTGAQVLPS